MVSISAEADIFSGLYQRLGVLLIDEVLAAIV